jgi:hypothetical protein
MEDTNVVGKKKSFTGGEGNSPDHAAEGVASRVPSGAAVRDA